MATASAPNSTAWRTSRSTLLPAARLATPKSGRCEITGRKPPVVTEDARTRPANSEVSRLAADNAKIRRLTGWKSEVGFRVGLERTVSWIRSNLAMFDTRQYAK